MERIFYKTDIIDAYSGHPFYIFDTSFLPAPEDIDYDKFVPSLMQWLPHQPYNVILFSCGLNNINWIWGIKFLKAFLALSSSAAENIHKIFAVHESWFVKSVTQIFSNFLVSKKGLLGLSTSGILFNNLIISCQSLSELSQYVDITRLKISLNIYRHDYETTLSTTIHWHCPIDPIITSKSTYSPAQSPLFYHHFYQLFNIVDTYGDKAELLFHKPGKKVNTDILFNCIQRNQLIWINDWDLHCVASCFKKILMEVPVVLLPIENISLPIQDSPQYTKATFQRFMALGSASAVLFQILDFCDKVVLNNRVTHHTTLSILKSLCHPLSHELVSVQNKHRISIAVRFLRNVLNHWREISVPYRPLFKSVRLIVNGEEKADRTIDELYNMSYDITVDNSVSSEDEREQNSSTEIVSDDLKSTPSSESIRETSIMNLNKSGSPVSLNNDSMTSLYSDMRNDILTPDNLAPDVPLVLKSPLVSEVAPKPQAKPPNPNVQLQFPPQKYKFERRESELKAFAQPKSETETTPQVKKPVIRGRKVGELTKLFEQRCEAMEILKTM